MISISAVIPCYNQGAFLADCISSILSQSVEVAEIIVVDDGSTETETISILNNLTFSKTKVISQKNQGLSAARNTGFRHAAGTWILVIDADDYFSPSFLHHALLAIASDETIGAVSCWVQMFGNQNDLWKCAGGDISDFLVKNHSSSAGLVRRELWQTAGEYDEQMPAYEDWDFWLRLTSLGYRVHVVPLPLFHYRKHRVSLLADNYDRHFELRRYIINKNKKEYDRYYPDVIMKLEEAIVNYKLKNRQSASRSFWSKVKNRLLHWVRKAPAP